jgi:acetyltransferase-like isoleucine patch superfamily enzyme
MIRSYLSSAFQLCLLLVAYIPSQTLRKALLRVCGARIAHDVRLYHGFEVRKPRNLEIASGTVIGTGAILDARGGISIGRNVNFSSEVAIWTVQHDPQSPSFGTKLAPVRIKDNAWISFRVVILPGVTVCEGAVVAAGAIVTKDVPPYSISAGIPAHVIGTRTRNLEYELGRAGYYHFI